MAKTNLNKLVAINAYNANCNIMRSLQEQGRQSSVLYLTAKWENERLCKRFPSLRKELFI